MATTAGLVGQEIQALETFDEMWTPGFVGKSLIHVGSVVVSFFGGRSSAAR